MLSLLNGLISQLSSSDQNLLMKHARLVEFKFGDVLTSVDPSRPWVFFLNSGSVALFVSQQRGDVQAGLAVGLVCANGALNLQAAWGMGQGNISLIVQSAGTAFRIDAHTLQNLVKRHLPWLNVFARYQWLIYQEISRLAALSHVLDTKQRLADWLLKSAKCCNSESIFMTHVHLAKMLGVRRSSITLAAREMKLKGLIYYSRGQITLLDPPALEVLVNPLQLRT